MNYLKMFGQAVLLWAIFRVGAAVVQALHLALPGNVMGMIILFILLCLGIIKPSHVQETADLLLKHLAFFFIPISVGLMTWGALIYRSGLVLLAALGISAVVALAATGLSVQFLHREK
jgi:holin-like protein